MKNVLKILVSSINCWSCIHYMLYREYCKLWALRTMFSSVTAWKLEWGLLHARHKETRGKSERYRVGGMGIWTYRTFGSRVTDRIRQRIPELPWLHGLRHYLHVPSNTFIIILKSKISPICDTMCNIYFCFKCLLYIFAICYSLFLLTFFYY